jgi:hypothetical protein
MAGRPITNDPENVKLAAWELKDKINTKFPDLRVVVRFVSDTKADVRVFTPEGRLYCLLVLGR